MSRCGLAVLWVVSARWVVERAGAGRAGGGRARGVGSGRWVVEGAGAGRAGGSRRPPLGRNFSVRLPVGLRSRRNGLPNPRGRRDVSMRSLLAAAALIASGLAVAAPTTSAHAG